MFSDTYRVVEVGPGKRLKLQANEAAPGGKPFFETIELSKVGAAPMGDVIEISPTAPGRAIPEGYRLWTSAPRELVALRVGDLDPLVREALSLALDRTSLTQVLLQRRAEPAYTMLPGWLTGYAKLFVCEYNPVKAANLLSTVRLSMTELAYPADDPVLRAIAERIAVNARDANIPIRAVPGEGGVQIRRLTFHNSDPLSALGEMLGHEDRARMPDLQSVLDAEKELLDSGTWMPVVHLSRTWAISPRVRVFREPPGADLSFADLMPATSP
jgi:hypothetical protein